MDDTLPLAASLQQAFRSFSPRPSLNFISDKAFRKKTSGSILVVQPKALLFSYLHHIHHNYDENTSRSFDPSILVIRVLPPTMTARARAPTTTATATNVYPSPPIPSLSPFVSPHTSRLITDTRGDRSQNSGTDSLGP